MADYRLPELSSFPWQPSVLACQNDPPGSPAEGDRYLVAAAPTGAWIGHTDEIAEWAGSAWEFTAPMVGMVVWQVDEHEHVCYTDDPASGWRQLEFDPLFGSSPAAGITTDQISHWDTAYGWGDHAGLYDAAGAAAAVQANLNTHAGNANAHHAQSHVLATAAGLGTDHTMSGATAGHVLRASSATAAAFAQLQHSDLGGVSADQHHARAHTLLSTSDHSDVGTYLNQAVLTTSSPQFAKVGIGVAPAAADLQVNLAVQSTAKPFHVGNATYGTWIGGGTGVPDRLSPLILLHAKDASDGAASVMLIAQCDAASDAGAAGLMRFDARRATGAPLATRPAFDFYNYSVLIGQASAAGNWTLGPPDTDVTTILGRVKLGNLVGLADYAVFSHFDHASVTNYALLQAPDGTTIVNAASGKTVIVRVNNAAAATFSSTALTPAGDVAMASNKKVYFGSAYIQWNSGSSRLEIVVP